MVIQRIQTVWLLVALVFMIFVGIRPIASSAGSGIFLTEMPVLVVIEALVGILLFLSIFLFKNLKLQKKVTLLSMVMMAVLGAAGAFFLYNNHPGAEIEWGGSIILLICSLVFAMLAYRGMSRDQRKLRASDSLWR